MTDFYIFICSPQRLYYIDTSELNALDYRPHEYAYEGEGSRCHSLDELSLCNADDDLKFLSTLDPKFTTLGSICVQSLKEKNIQI